MSGPRPGAHGRAAHERELGAPALFALALAAGALGAGGSLVFRAAIALVQNLLFQGRIGVVADAHAPLAPSPWGAGIIAVPVIGALGVTWITRRLSSEVRGSGVPEVLYALYYHGGRMRPRVALAKALASALSIGSGASVGREGPIVQIGAVLGAGVGSLARIPAHQRVVLVAGGAAAGIAATFNAPLGGLAFAVELLLISVSARNVALVASATAVATYLAGLVAGFGPLFPLPGLAGPASALAAGPALLACVPFGLAAGLAAAALERGISGVEDVSSALVGNDYLRHAAAMLIVGVMLYAFVERTGDYHVAGVGYPTIEAIVTGLLADPAFLLLLFAAKLVATTLALGTGASGGVFAPGLFLGAALGAGYGHALDALWPALGVEPVVLALAGMAALVGATTAAVVTAIVMVLELTHGYAALLPIVLTVALAYVVRLWLTPESVYTLNLARRGRTVPHGLQAAVSEPLDAEHVMSRDFALVERGAPAEGGPPLATRPVLVTDGGTVAGFALPGGGIDACFRIVAPATRWPDLMRTLKAHGCERLVVATGTGADTVVGVITPREVARAARDKADLMD